MRLRVLGMAAGLAMICGGASIGPVLARQQEEKQMQTREEALDVLAPMMGEWTGTGFLRMRLEQQPTPMTTRWSVARGFDGAFVRMEFLIRIEGRADSHWVAYLTYLPEEDKYHSVWTWVSAGRDFKFHETGAFDSARGALSLVSMQPKPGGAPGETIEVLSVFTLGDGDHFKVEDTRRDDASGERFSSLFCELTRTR